MDLRDTRRRGNDRPPLRDGTRSSAMSEPLWQPTERAAASTNLAHFSAAAAKACGQPLTTYEALHEFSTRDPGAFWHLLWTYCGVHGDPGAAPYLVDREQMPGARFF